MKPLGRAALIAVALAALAAPTAHAAAPAVVSGKLTGAKLPAAGKGRVPVWAMRLSNGTIAGGTSATSGRFVLTLPAGSYAIFAAVIPARGTGNPILRVADFVTAKAGKARRIKPTLKKRHKPRKKKRRHARASASGDAHAAFVDVDYLALAVHPFTAPAGPLKIMGNGMRDMLVTDIAGAVGTPSCPGAVVASDGDLQKVLDEIKLTQTPYFDESTRLTTAHIVNANAHVNGSIASSGGTVTLTATFTDRRPGQVRSATVSASGPESDFFGVEQQLAQKLVSVICVKTTESFAGTFSGTWTTDFNNYKVTWTGDAIIDKIADHSSPPQDAPPGDYAQYAVRSGKVHAVLDGTRGNCTDHGEADFQIQPGPASGTDYLQHADQPWYTLSITTRGDEQIPYTETGGAGCGQQDAAYPLTGVQYVFTPKPLQSADAQHLTGNTSWGGDQFNPSSHYSSQFSFAPAG
ncbi:MAG: hypothetical protein ACJ77M_06865 [Thermoleophilaceae bacterium]